MVLGEFSSCVGAVVAMEYRESFGARSVGFLGLNVFLIVFQGKQHRLARI